MSQLEAPRRVLLLGVGSGDSGLSIAHELAEDGLLIVIEPDEARAQAARRRFEAAGVSARVSVLIGDPRRYLHKLAGPFDRIAYDGDPSHYEGLRTRLDALLKQP